MEQRGSYTLSFDNQYTEEMLKTFLACQSCRSVNTKTKQLQCGHTICQKCAIMSSKKQGDKWLLRCSTCRGVTTCYDEGMSALRDIKTVQKLVEKTRPAFDSLLFNDTPRRREENLSVNIVSSSREKQEIRKVLETAKRKMQLCHDQRKLVHTHEKRVQSAKIKLEKQIRDSVDAFICAIRTHQDQLLDELNQLFREDFQPIEEAIDCLEMQMQSMKLVTECCSVAGRILKGGGAPMDMNNFKKMVRQTMGKSKAGKIPNAIQKAYKPRVFYKSNEDQYDEMAERIGKLIVRKEKKQQMKTREVEQKKTREIVVQKQEYREKRQTAYVEEEPIYDIVPQDMATRYNQAHFDDYGEPEDFYDEIPFFSDDVFHTSRTGSEAPSIIAGFVSQTQNQNTSSYIPPAPSLASASVPHGHLSTPSSILPAPPVSMTQATPQTSGFISAPIPLPPPAPMVATVQNPYMTPVNIPPPPPLPSTASQIPNNLSVIPPPPPAPIPAPVPQPELASSNSYPNSYTPPAPVTKNNHGTPLSPQTPSLPPPSSNPCDLISEATVALFARRKAINGDDSDSEQSVSDLSILEE